MGAFPNISIPMCDIIFQRGHISFPLRDYVYNATGK